MNGLGEFSTHVRDGNQVTKRLTSRHPAGRRFVTSMARTGEAGMRAYLDDLRSAAVVLPAGLHISSVAPLTVRHQWVPGATLVEVAGDAPAAFSSAIAEIGHWVRALDRSDACIDTNLANFCLVGDRPILVDVLPPLIPSLRPAPATLFDELFGALCFDTPVILDALIGYALRATLRTGNWSASRLLLPIAYDLTPASGDSVGFPASWFRTRRHLAIRASEGAVSLEQLEHFFALTSVLAFLRLDEAGRHLRVEQVARRIRKLGM